MFENTPNETYLKKFKESLKLLDEKFLSNSKYVAGESLTVADILMVGCLSILDAMDYPLDDYPHVTAWIKRVKQDLQFYGEICDAGVKGEAVYLLPLVEGARKSGIM